MCHSDGEDFSQRLCGHVAGEGEGSAFPKAGGLTLIILPCIQPPASHGAKPLTAPGAPSLQLRRGSPTASIPGVLRQKPEVTTCKVSTSVPGAEVAPKVAKLSIFFHIGSLPSPLI